MKLIFFIGIKLLFAAEFTYENSSLLCLLHFRLFYTYFESIFSKNGHEENFYHYNSHRYELWNHEMRRRRRTKPNQTNQIKTKPIQIYSELGTVDVRISGNFPN